MKENFDNEFNLTDENQNNRILSEDGADIGDYQAQKIIIPETKHTPEKSAGKGIKVFCLVIAAIIALSCFSFGGYFLGKNSVLSNQPSTKAPSIILQQKPADNDEFSPSKLYSDVSKSVVGILVYNKSGKIGEASGVVYSADGYIITNDHIYSDIGSARFKVFTFDGNEYDAYYVAGDTRSDLAVLKISDKVSLNVPAFGNSDEVVSGEKVCAIGYPNGYNSSSTITSGIVSVPKVRMSITTSYSTNFIQTDTAINPGNSGGALVNMYGQIIGITSSKISATSYEGTGFAIPTKTVQKIIKSLVESGNVKDRARLGISYNFINNAMAELSELTSCGLLVREVSKDSDLFGKLAEGDLITRVNDIAITDDAVILDLLEECKPGDSILLTVIKASGDKVTVSAKLLNDEGSSSYVNSDESLNGKPDGGEFNWPEGF